MIVNVYRDLVSEDVNATIVLCEVHAHMAGKDIDYIGPTTCQCELCEDTTDRLFVAIIHYCSFYDSSPQSTDPIHEVYPYNGIHSPGKFQDYVSLQCRALNKAAQSQQLTERKYYYYRLWKHSRIDV